MKPSIFFVIFIIFQSGFSFCGAIEDDFTTKDAVMIFANDINQFFDYFLSGSNTGNYSEHENESIVEAIDDRIGSITGSVIFDEKLPQLTDLRVIATTEQRLLRGAKNIITAETEKKREAYMRRYVDDFKSLKNRIYSLKDVHNFKGTISGVTKTFPGLISDLFNCGQSNLRKVQTNYMMLVSNAAALDVLTERLGKTDLYNDTLAMWTQDTVDLLNVFEKQIQDCKHRFHALSSADFERIRNTTALFTNNQNRFSDNASDVLFLKGGSYCVNMLKDYNNILERKDHDETMTIAYFGERKPATATEINSFVSVAKHIKFEYCKSDMERILPLFDVIGYDLEMMIMYLTNQSEDFELHFDKESPIIFEADVTSQYSILLYVTKQNGHDALQANDYKTYTNNHPVQSIQSSTGTSFGCGMTLVFVVSVISSAFNF